MGDAGTIGSILEDTIDALKIMNENKELSKDNLRLGLILINSINESCKEQGINLYIEKEYFEYMKQIVPEL